MEIDIYVIKYEGKYMVINDDYSIGWTIIILHAHGFLSYKGAQNCCKISGFPEKSIRKVFVASVN